MIHLNEAIVGINKRPKQIGTRAIKDLKIGDSLWFVGYSTYTKKITSKKRKGTMVLDEDQREFVSKDENSFYLDNPANFRGEIIAGGYDYDYMVERGASGWSYIFAFDEIKLDELIATYCK